METDQPELSNGAIEHRTRIAGKGKNRLVELIITAFLGLLACISIFPFYNVLITSFGEASAMAKQSVYLIPTSFNLTAYEYIFSGDKILKSFLISFVVTVGGTFTNLLLSLCGAYALSKRTMPGRNIMLYMILFTMFFSGGLIPYYLTVKDIGLVNNILVMIVPLAVNTFYLIIVMSYFRTLPPALEESAKIDGANDIQILAKIIIPISMPTIAAVGLFYAVDRWNEWWHAMLFISDINKYPLQLLLRQVLVNFNEILQNGIASSMAQKAAGIYPDTIKMAVVVVASIPILLVYPFLQKYFTKGMMLGSIKG
ncbi:carbohydrate ABC transporter permease [Cohnella abietis]|uniref:Putative ABC transporter permease protein YtcP n=1 Tax=Cohnella abietis TaxID=2507935 RepID=A0A3T1D1N1_9BACL|nr:carbohydrate ABC transporter permease [Cohnella abietis]BBI31915.1 putative ABC transporter permease protein YtcP [Cohnella abietis]